MLLIHTYMYTYSPSRSRKADQLLLHTPLSRHLPIHPLPDLQTMFYTKIRTTRLEYE